MTFLQRRAPASGLNLNHLAAFVAVAQAGSFTAAARGLRVDKGHLSRVVRALEARLGVVLLTRASRAVALTAEGERLLASAAAPLASLEQATAVLGRAGQVPAGEVTLTTTPDLGRAVVAPLLVDFRLRYPAVQVRLVLEASLLGLQRARADVAVRIGGVRERAVRARRVGELEAGFFAAPRYLEARGTPKSVGDLAAHDGLWPRTAPGQRSFNPGARPPRAAVECDDFGALLELARGGAGVALLPTFLAGAAVTQGALRRVLPQLTLGGAPVWLVTQPERPLPPRVTALRDLLVDALPRRLAALANA